jgi:mycothiol synthase
MAQHAAFVLRPYHRSDAAAVVEVVNAAAQPLGMRRALVDSAGHVRLIRYVPGSSKKVVVINPQDEVVGYAYLADRDQHIIYEVGGAVHPSYQQQGIGTHLLAWAEQQALSMSTSAPAGVKTVLQTNLYEAEREAIGLFSGHGYARVRAWLHFAIEFEAPPGVPPLPDGLHLREMDFEQDDDLVDSAMEEAFADHWGTIRISDPEAVANEEGEEAVDVPEDESFSNAPGFCFVVVDERTNKAAGGILCNAKLVERDDTGRVGSVFVRPAYRRQGVGRALMWMTFRKFWQHGIRRVILDTDIDSFTKAPAFYTSLGMRQYRHEFLYEKEVRPGREVRRLSI